MGADFRRAATAAEIDVMKALVERGMKDGAVGLSSGLEYDPGFYATVDELAARLHAHGINVGREIDRGSLKLLTRRDWRQPGRLSSEKKSRQVLDFIARAGGAGFKGARFGVWFLPPGSRS